MRGLHPVIAVTVIAGCNAVFDLAKTQPAPPIDATYFDAPADAPYACPVAGVPAFSPYLHQAFVQFDCRDYNASLDGFAVATCTFPAQLVGDKLVTIPELADASAPGYGAPRIAPEGDTLFITRGPEVHVYMRTPTGAWIQGPSLAIPLTLDYGASIGVPSAGPRRRMMLKPLSSDTAIHEIEFDVAGNVNEVHPYTPSELGAPRDYIPVAPSLTPDGSRLVFVADDASAYNSVFYASRVGTSALFGPADRVPAIGGVNDPFMTADCGHLYFSAVGSVVYVKQ